MEPSFSSIQFSKIETLHYKSEFQSLCEAHDSISHSAFRDFLKKMKLSDHDVQKVLKMTTTTSPIKLPNFMSAMRLCSLIKQGKKYSGQDIFTEQKVLARRSRAEHKPDPPKLQPVAKHSTRIEIREAVLVNSGWFGASSYYTYKIVSDIEGTVFEVSRRFSDLDWLHQTLSLNYKGYIVPVLPSKKIISNTDPMFVDKRKGEMEKFLNFVRMHDVLGECKEFLGFLKYDENEFIKMKEDQVKEEWFEVKGIRDTIDQTFASIESKFGLGIEKLTHSQYLEIEVDVTKKKDILKEVSDHFKTWVNAQVTSNKSYEDLITAFQDPQPLSSLITKTEVEMKTYVDIIEQESLKINTLHTTLAVYQASLEKKSTASNIIKRKSSKNVENQTSDEELLKNLTTECDKILNNLQCEHKSITKSITFQLPSTFKSLCKTQLGFASSLVTSIRL